MVSRGGGVVQESKSSLQPCILMTDRRENCLILQTNVFNSRPQLLYDIGGEIPEFLGRSIICSFGEWVVLTITSIGDTRPELLFNRLSKEIIELPVLDLLYDDCILTSHPYDPACRVVYFDREGSVLMFWQPGDKEFTFKMWDYEFFPTPVGAVVAGKLFLSIIIPNSLFVIGVIELQESTYRFEVVKMDSEIKVNYFSYYVYCEYSGELFAIYRTNRSWYLTGFEILKADFLNKKWVRVKNLGTLAFFFCYQTAHVQCASVESGIKANSIYFLELYDLDHYYIYNLEDGTIKMKPIFSSSMEMETTKGTRLHWIMMHCDASFPKLLKGDQESICQEDSEASGEVEEVGVQNSWNMVPPELLNLIQLHLFGRDNVVFRVVCKPWHIRDYSIPSIPALLELCQSSSPLLMFQEDITISYDSVPTFRFFDPVHRMLYSMGIPELRETYIQYSKDGWLLVSGRGDGSIFFLNPLTREKIELPRLPTKRIFSPHPSSLSFSCVPTCSDCLVVGIADFVIFYTLKRGEQRWRGYEMGEFQMREYMRCPVVLNGLHHFMCMNRDMIVFNWKDGVECQPPYCQSWPIKFKRPEHHEQDYFLEDFFLEIDGVIAFVSVEPDGGEINIYKWNDLETGWELMEGGVEFGGKEMFLSRRGSFLQKIDDLGGMGNTIFLPMIDDAKEGVFYSLATHKYHTLYSRYSSELPYEVDKFLNGIWVKPDRKIVGGKNLKWFM